MLEITSRDSVQTRYLFTGREKTVGELLDSREMEAQNLLDRMQEARQRAAEQQKRFVIKNSANYGAISMTACARLAKARSRADVGAVSGYARRQIASLKTAARQDADNAPRIKAVVAQLEKVVARAGKKKKDLAKEELMAHRQARAEEELRRREALRLRSELQKRRSSRALRESGYLREAALDDWAQVQRAADQEAARLQAEALAPGSYSGAVQQYAATAAGAAPVGEVSVGVDLQI